MVFDYIDLIENILKKILLDIRKENILMDVREVKAIII